VYAYGRPIPNKKNLYNKVSMDVIANVYRL
jgi:hypothetical protein